MKTLFRVTMLIILSLTLATCATAQAGNAMNEGSARASGNTVTLTRNVGVQGNLTVPAGVTLDLTGDSGIWIQRDNVTLTVNGTVNAPSNRIGFDSGSGARTMIINGNGTINLTGKGSLLIVWSGDGVARKLTLDGVTLVGIADNDQPLVRTGVDGELVMVNGAITGNSTSHPCAGVFVDQGGIFTMSGGTISGNTSTNDNGGGLLVYWGTFTMEDGTVSGNSSIRGGVGVRGGTFTFIGGTIYGASAEKTEKQITQVVIMVSRWLCG